MPRQGDGSESDPEGLPQRYLVAHKQKRNKALDALKTTKTWRSEHLVDTLLSRPHPKYDLCKAVFPILIPGRDTTNHLIIVQRPGLIQFKLADEHNVTMEDLLFHYIYMVEYCWNLLEPAPLPPDGLMTTVMDCQGVSFGTFTNKAYRSFLMRFVSTMSEHYPTRSYKTLIINAPKWIQMVFKVVKPLLRESTRAKIMILNGGKEQDRILKEVLGDENVPKELLSDYKPKLDGGEAEDINDSLRPVSSIEEDMRLFCKTVTEKYGQTIQTCAV